MFNQCLLQGTRSRGSQCFLWSIYCCLVCSHIKQIILYKRDKVIWWWNRKILWRFVRKAKFVHDQWLRIYWVSTSTLQPSNHTIIRCVLSLYHAYMIIIYASIVFIVLKYLKSSQKFDFSSWKYKVIQHFMLTNDFWKFYLLNHQHPSIRFSLFHFKHLTHRL